MGREEDAQDRDNTAACMVPSGEWFGYAADRLHDLGWSPIPLQGKVPVVRDWQRWNDQLVPIEFRKQWTQQYFYHGVGICVAPWTVVVDLDVSSRTEAENLFALAREELGWTPCVRVGQAPKSILLYQCAPYEVAARRLRGLDIYCGTGQFAAFGIHPDTHKPYKWRPTHQRNPEKSANSAEAWITHPPMSPLDIKPTDLPRTSETAIAAFIDRAVAAGYVSQRSHAPQDPNVAGVRTYSIREAKARREMYASDPSRKTLAWDRGLFGLAFKYAGLVRSRPHRDGDRIGVVCPWTTDHGSGAGSSTSTIIWGPMQDGGWGRLHCSHSGCLDALPGERSDEALWQWIMDNFPMAGARAMRDVGMIREEDFVAIVDGFVPRTPTEKAAVAIMLAAKEDEQWPDAAAANVNEYFDLALKEMKRDGES